MRLAALTAMVALAGCGGSGSGASTTTPAPDSAKVAFKLNTPSHGQAIVHVASEAEAARICDAAQAGDYDQLKGVTQLIEKLPGSTPGANTDGTQCMLPGEP